MEHERRALGLQGVLFRYYACPDCGYADIFLDLTRLPDEDDEAFRRRRGELETMVSDLQAERVEVVIDER
jgi:hypothetical protein